MEVVFLFPAGVGFTIAGLRDFVCAVCWYPVLKILIGLASASTSRRTSAGGLTFSEGAV